MALAIIGLTAEQQEIRRKRIGASEVAAILGLDPWKAPVDIWLEKTGRAERDAMSEAAEWGLRKEPIVLDKYRELHGVELVQPGTLIHPEVDLLAATPDSIVVPSLQLHLDAGSECWERDVQVKCPRERQRAFWGEPGSDDIPEHYWLQVQAEMAVTGLDTADVVALFGGDTYVEYCVARDEATISDMLEAVQRWWRDHVVADVSPEVTGRNAERILLRRHPKSNGEIIDAPATLLPWIEKVRQAKRYEAQAKALLEEARPRVIEAIGDNKGLCGEWGRITYSTVNRKPKVDWEGVARALSPPADLIAQHTSEPEPSRRFLTQFHDIEEE